MSQDDGFRGRFDQKIDHKGDKWHWNASVNSDGYPKIKDHGKLRLASHVSLELDGRKAPGPGQVVLHKDNDPKNINPNNLIVGTQKQNLKQMRDEGRDRPRGVAQQPDAKQAAAADLPMSTQIMIKKIQSKLANPGPLRKAMSRRANPFKKLSSDEYDVQKMISFSEEIQKMANHIVPILGAVGATIGGVGLPLYSHLARRQEELLAKRDGKKLPEEHTSSDLVLKGLIGAGLGAGAGSLIGAGLKNNTDSGVRELHDSVRRYDDEVRRSSIVDNLVSRAANLKYTSFGDKIKAGLDRFNSSPTLTPAQRAQKNNEFWESLADKDGVIALLLKIDYYAHRIL